MKQENIELLIHIQGELSGIGCITDNLKLSTILYQIIEDISKVIEDERKQEVEERESE